MEDEEQLKKLTIRLEPKLHKQLKIKGVECDISMNGYTKAFLNYSLSLSDVEIRTILKKYTNSDW